MAIWQSAGFTPMKSKLWPNIWSTLLITVQSGPVNQVGFSFCTEEHGGITVLLGLYFILFVLNISVQKCKILFFLNTFQYHTAC